jgi:hypothetical protein
MRTRSKPNLAVLSGVGCKILTLFIALLAFDFASAANHDQIVVLDLMEATPGESFFAMLTNYQNKVLSKTNGKLKPIVIRIQSPEDLQEGSSAFNQMARLGLTPQSKLLVLGHGLPGESTLVSQTGNEYEAKDIASFIAKTSPILRKNDPFFRAIKISSYSCSAGLAGYKETFLEENPSDESKSFAIHLLESLYEQGVRSRISGATGRLGTRDSGEISGVLPPDYRKQTIAQIGNQKNLLEQVNQEVLDKQEKYESKKLLAKTKGIPIGPFLISSEAKRLRKEQKEAESKAEEIRASLTEAILAQEASFRNHREDRTAKVTVSLNRKGEVVKEYGQGKTRKGSKTTLAREDLEIDRKILLQELQVYYNNRLFELDEEIADPSLSEIFRKRLREKRKNIPSELRLREAAFQMETRRLLAKFDSDNASLISPVKRTQAQKTSTPSPPLPARSQPAKKWATVQVPYLKGPSRNTNPRGMAQQIPLASTEGIVRALPNLNSSLGRLQPLPCNEETPPTKQSSH